MTQTIHNPVNFLSLLPLSPAEVKFAACLAEGKPCLIEDKGLPAPEKRIESGEAANVVRGEVIRFFVYGGDEKNPVLGPSVHLIGAWIDGVVDLEHARIPYALSFYQCHFANAVTMLGAECAALYMDDSCLADIFIADNMTTTSGGVHLRGDFSAEAGMGLRGANFGGNLDCRGGKFRPDLNGYALHADGMTTKSVVLLSDGFSAEGEVRLVGANIGGNLFCQGGKFHNPQGCALNITLSNIERGFVFTPHKMSGGGSVELRYAKTSVLTDGLASWNQFKVVLDGFAYDRFSFPADAEFRIKWLNNRPDSVSFSPLPYEQAAKVLFEMGHANDAREILLKKERLQTADERTPWHHKIGRQLWDVFAGYGYRLRRTAYWMVGIVVLGAFLFNFADENGRMVPHQPVVLADMQYKAVTIPACVKFKCPPEKRPTEVVKRLFPAYPEFNALVYSLDVFIPLFALHQEPSWAPASGGDGDFWKSPPLLAFFVALLIILGYVSLFFQHWRKNGKDEIPTPAAIGVGVFSLLMFVNIAASVGHCLFGAESALWLFDSRLLTIWYWFEIMAGWILSSLFLLSVTGLLRPRIGGGD